MSSTLSRVRALVARGEVQVSLHGYEELSADNIRIRDVLDGLAGAVVVEDYPDEVGRNMAKEANMSAVATKRLVREGDFVAEVAVTLLETEGGWTPYLSLEDAYKLDDVREALKAGDVKRASRIADRVYRLTPVEA